MWAMMEKFRMWFMGTFKVNVPDSTLTAERCTQNGVRRQQPMENRQQTTDN
jgi:hypothetical protein